MPTEFELALEDFEAELAAIEGVMTVLSSSGDATAPPRARVAAANGATLLLAAAFEEFVRQLIRALFTARVASAASMADFPQGVAGKVWRRALERLARSTFEELEQTPTDVESRLQAAVDFCIRKDFRADVSEALAHNEQNMRPDEINRMFNQLGLQNACGQACGFEPLLTLLGYDTPGKAQPELKARLDGFFLRRNNIAHALTLNSSSGGTGLAVDIELFRQLGRALTAGCVQFCTPALGRRLISAQPQAD